MISVLSMPFYRFMETGLLEAYALIDSIVRSRDPECNGQNGQNGRNLLIKNANDKKGNLTGSYPTPDCMIRFIA